MKKILTAIICVACLVLSGTAAFAAETPLQDTPYLESISFSNAEIDGGFNTGETYFTLTLQNSNNSAVLESYEINGTANIVAEYFYDSANRQIGITVTLKFDSGSIIYTFTYSNPAEYEVNSNANLAGISCEYSEVQPEINSEDTVYTLYIPSDMTELNITPITQDINATASLITVILREGQETEIPITVTASDGSTKKYTFEIKRVDKTTSEIAEEMAQPDFVSFVDDARFYNQPESIVAACAVAGGIVFIIIIAAVIRRVAANPYDADEKDFYLTP